MYLYDVCVLEPQRRIDGQQCNPGIDEYKQEDGGNYREYLPTVPATKLNRPSTAISTKFWNRPGIIAALRAPKMNNSTKIMLAIQEERMALKQTYVY